MHGVWPMCREVAGLIGSLLAQEILFRGINDRHETSVRAEASLCPCRRNIVMRCTRVPDNEITRFGANLLPFQTFVLQPLHPNVGETIPFIGPNRVSRCKRECHLGKQNSPCPNFVRLILKLLVEIFAEFVCTLTDDEATIIWPIWQNIDEPL